MIGTCFFLSLRYVANRPLFSHQLGTTHFSSIHSGHLNGHERDRSRTLFFFYDDELGTEEPDPEDDDVFSWIYLGAAHMKAQWDYFGDDIMISM